MVSDSSKNVLDEILDPLADCFTSDVAQRIVAISIAPRNQSRIDYLATKANEGQLGDSELTEYEEYVQALDLLGIVKAKARQSLAQRGMP